MKKKIAILFLVAVFVSGSSLSAQTKPVTKTSTAKTEVKADKNAVTPTAACCKGKTAECCKSKTVAEKAKCKNTPVK